MTPAAHRVAVVVVAFHGDRWIGPCVASLATAAIRPLRLILVDNDRTTGLTDLAPGPHSLEFLPTGRAMGFAEANNLALGRLVCETDFIALLNQDTQGEPGWLDAVVSAMAGNSRRGAATPLLRTYDGAGWDPHFEECARAAGWPLGASTRGMEGPWISCPQITAAAMVVRSEALRATGPFDPVYGSYYEDYDLCLRLRRTGWDVGIATSGTVRHYSGSATQSPEQRERRRHALLRNRAILRIRAAPKRLPALTRALAIDGPHNLLRAWRGRPDAPPSAAALAAWLDLMHLAPRLATTRRDRREWERALRAMEWPAEAGEKEPSVADPARQ